MPTANRCSCSVVIPTRNRRDVLAETLRHLGALGDRDFETIVVDNGSTDDTLSLQTDYPRVRWIALGANLGSAARNVGGAAARGNVLLMLDDDSWPAEGTMDRLGALFESQPDLGAAACRVRLVHPPFRHDAGGVPGVFFNCGGAVRRRAFLEVGGFPVDFDYYVEEYDLCCRLVRAGWRTAAFGDLLVWHRRVSQNRDNCRMLHLLVRNNLRLWARYAPPAFANALMADTMERYRRVARKENALSGYLTGLSAGRKAAGGHDGGARPLTVEQFEALYGLDRFRAAISDWVSLFPIDCVVVWSRGKGCDWIVSVLESEGISVRAIHDVPEPGETRWRRWRVKPFGEFEPEPGVGVVIGSLSVGVAQDLAEMLASRHPGLPVLAPTDWESSVIAENATEPALVAVR